MELFRPDKPVELESEDSFQRYSFAKRIASIVTNNHFPQSVVVGVYGKWGEGKTSVLQFVKKEIADNAVVVNFNPWLFNDEKQLLKSFFEAMASAVGKKLQSKKEKIANAFGDYADSIGSLASEWIPGAGIVFTAGKKLTEKFRKDSIEELKQRIDGLIIDANINFVVFVDDIDRLDVDEIQSVFKLVKLVGEFPRTSYILSFDDDIVAAALGPKYASGDKNAGHSFLEKIIQIPLHLPKASSKALRRYTLNLIEETFQKLGIALDKKTLNNFVKNFDETFVPVISSPRVGVRLANSVGFIVPLLDGEVDISDLLTIESIKAFFPQLYHFIRNNGDYFLSIFTTEESRYGTPFGPTKTAVRKAIDSQLEVYGNEHRQKILMVLSELFPQLMTVYQNHSFPDTSFMEWHRNKRICSFQHFSRYFSYVVQEGDISDTFFSELLNGLETLSETELREKFVQRFRLVSVPDLIFKFRYWEKQFPEHQAEPLAKVLAGLGDSYNSIDQAILQASTFGMAASFIAALIKSVPPGKIRKLSLEVLERAEPFQFCFEIVFNLIETRDDEHGQNRFQKSDIAVIGASIVQKFKNLLKNSDLLQITDETNFHLLIYWWSLYNDVAELRSYLAKKMEDDVSFSFNLLKAFTPSHTRFRMGDTKPAVVKSNFSINTYTDISQVIEPALLLRKIEEVYGEISPIEKIPEPRASLSDEAIRRIFKKIHLQVLAKEITLSEPWTRAINIENNS